MWAKSLAIAFPDRLSRRRDASGETWQSVGGRGFRLDATSSLARSQWLAVGEVAGHAAGARILSGCAIDEEAVTELFRDRIAVRHEADFDLSSRSVTPTRIRRLGAIRLATGPDPEPDQQAIERALLEAVCEHGFEILPWDERSRQLRDRAAFAHTVAPDLPAFDDATLRERREEWLAPLLQGKRRLTDIKGSALAAAVEQLLDYQQRRELDRIAPPDFVSPAGSCHPIDYGSPAGPTVEVRAQALFGLASHPMVGGGRVPLVIALTSPAGRPIQTTKDLPAFWFGSWREVLGDFGSIRASQQCLQCHAVPHGALLGAFTYELVRDPPVKFDTAAKVEAVQ